MIVIAVLAGLGTVSCLGRIQDVYNVPPEYQGVWSDAEAGMEMIIKERMVIYYNTKQDPERVRPDTVNIEKVFIIGRELCTDCTQYGVEIQFDKDGYRISRFYVHGWNKRLQSWSVLMEDESVKDLTSGARDYMERRYWKQIFPKTGGK
jgi:hypothetical protein